MKHINVDIDWLASLDGATVAQAIAYLQTLDPTHYMAHWNESDGATDVTTQSNLFYRRPFTEEEQAAETQRRNASRVNELNHIIGHYELGLASYKRGFPIDIEDARARIAHAKAELETLK